MFAPTQSKILFSIIHGVKFKYFIALKFANISANFLQINIPGSNMH